MRVFDLSRPLSHPVIANASCHHSAAVFALGQGVPAVCLVGSYIAISFRAWPVNSPRDASLWTPTA
jgi:hypothetical protein